jgi:hypothetical protein
MNRIVGSPSGIRFRGRLPVRVERRKPAFTYTSNDDRRDRHRDGFFSGGGFAQKKQITKARKDENTKEDKSLLSCFRAFVIDFLRPRCGDAPVIRP